jgi:hypothetical protein
VGRGFLEDLRRIDPLIQGERSTLAFMRAKMQTNKDVFKEGEKCQRPNNGADASNDIVLRRYRTVCGPYSVEDIQR